MPHQPTPHHHEPERTCVACRRKRPQRELLRLTREGERWVLSGARRTGRGAYLCADSPECWGEKRLRRLGASAVALAEQLRARATVNPVGTTMQTS